LQSQWYHANTFLPLKEENLYITAKMTHMWRSHLMNVAGFWHVGFWHVGFWHVGFWHVGFWHVGFWRGFLTCGLLACGFLTWVS